MQGHFGVECDVRLLAPAETAELTAWISLYKSLRSVLHQGRTWQGVCADNISWQAYAPVAQGGQEGVKRCILMVYRLQPTIHTFTPALRLPMLQASARYRVQRIDPQPSHVFHHADSSHVFDQIDAGEFICMGEWLHHVGLPLPRMKAEQAMVLELTQV